MSTMISLLKLMKKKDENKCVFLLTNNKLIYLNGLRPNENIPGVETQPTVNQTRGVEQLELKERKPNVTGLVH